MATCPNGHVSASTDYCDTCGAPMGASAQPDPAVAAEKVLAGEPTPVATGGVQPGLGGVPAAGGASKACPNCRGVNPPNALFCEECGYDFTTGSLPRGAEPAAPAQTDAAGAAPAAVPAASLDLDGPDPAAPAVPEFTLPGDDDPGVVDADVVSVSEPEDASPAAPVGAPAEEPVAEPVDAPGPEGPVDADVIEDEPTPAPEPIPVAEPVEAAVEVPPAVPPVAAGVPAVAAEPTPAAEPVEAAEPEPVASGAAEWVAEVWIDPDWYAGQDNPDQLPSPGLPRVIGLRKRASLIGRPSRSRGITPDIDCEPDTGVSRRHAELATDGTRWWVEDLGSSNGTYVGEAGEPLPEEPIRGRAELGEDSRVYVGSWTRIVVRRANPDEADL